MKEKKLEKEKCIIVQLDLSEDRNKSEDKLLEISELARSAEIEVLATISQNAKSINAATYIGSGKALEIKEMADNMEADVIIFNNELTGSQMKNLEEIIDKKIIDRTGLILDIFARRATTKEGKLQVKLAQLEYRLPRLVGFRNYLSREGAGVGTRGPGEQKLEMDRRTIQKEITSIKNQLKDSYDQRMIKSKKRKTSSIPIVSLIGYSNAGKSTILNKILEIYGQEEKKVYSDNLLFATLDVSARKIGLENKKDIIITDTVGFVTDLPTKLIESFRGTLEEIELSDLIVVVIDSSNIDYKTQLKATTDVLKEMDLADKKLLYCFNKIDINDDLYIDLKDEEVVRISALKEQDIKKLMTKVQELVFADYSYISVKVPYDKIDVFMKNSDGMIDSSYEDQYLAAKVFVHKSKIKDYEEYNVQRI